MATDDQIADFRADLDDKGDPPAFSDAELARLWERAAGDRTGALLLAVRQLLAQSARFHDYTYGQGATQQKRSQVYAQLERWEIRLLAELAAHEAREATAVLAVAGTPVAVRVYPVF